MVNKLTLPVKATVSVKLAYSLQKIGKGLEVLRLLPVMDFWQKIMASINLRVECKLKNSTLCIEF